MTSAPREYARYWCSPLMPESSFVTARYVSHEFTPHWHDTFTIGVIEAGAEQYRYRGENQLAPRGTLCIVNPGELHTGSGATDEGWAYRVFYPSLSFMEKLAQGITGLSTAPPTFDLSVIRDAEVVLQLGQAHRLLEAAGDLMQAESALVRAMGMLLQRHTRICAETSPNEKDPRVATMKACLADNLTANLTLSELADTVGLSAWHAMRLFSRSTGLPPHAWRTQLRINRSLRLLKQGQAVSKVAADTGFTDQSHFTRHFRRAFGVPPGRWQAAHAKEQ